MNLIGRKFNGYRVMAIHNKFAIACNPRAVEPWVVWRIDKDGDFYGGNYFSDKSSAVSFFRSKGYKGYV